MKTTTDKSKALAAKYILRMKSFAANRTLVEIACFQQEERDRLNDIATKLDIELDSVDDHIEELLSCPIKTLQKIAK